MDRYVKYVVMQQRQDGKWISARLPFSNPELPFRSVLLARAFVSVWRDEWEKSLSGLPLPYDIAGLGAIRIVKQEIIQEVVE